MSFWNFSKKENAKAPTSTESQLIGVVLKDDILYFYNNPGLESIKRICDTLINVLAQKDYFLNVPFDPKSIEKGGIDYLMLNHSQLGEAYKAYTGLAGFGLDDGYPMATMSVLTFFEHIARDTASGLILDHKCGRDSNIVLSRENIFKILFAVHLKQKNQVKNDDEVFDEKFVFAEKGLIYDNVDLAIKKYIFDESDESYAILCQQLIYAVLYNISYRMATNGSPLTPAYAVSQHKQFGPVYMLFTSMESVVLNSEYSCRFATIRTIFDRVIDDDVNGILLDGTIFISKENVQNIVKYGYEQIELQPPIKKKFMLEKM